ncbi:MAG: PPC domain-containing DNA-binding protein [Pirellulaceae bacterium]
MQWQVLHEDGGERVLILVFEAGDEVMALLQGFSTERHLQAAHFSAIGAFRQATLGYFDWETKDYRRIPVNDQTEVVSLLGDIALDEQGEPKVHAHVVLGKSDGTAMAGHLLEAKVRPTLELVLTQTPAHLQRKLDPASGLALIQPSASS